MLLFAVKGIDEKVGVSAKAAWHYVYRDRATFGLVWPTGCERSI